LIPEIVQSFEIGSTQQRTIAAESQEVGYLRQRAEADVEITS
jgi:hypothetical protein